ncbi:MAG TPA: Rieske 2Fe-2S domain-containing protein [Hyphomicrobiales bacterium]|nr:Rieske 2Fe-2S domain-containing protein [Hyphomicrobiales bacterium]
MAGTSDSDDLLWVGPGTVMGEFMRQFWMPAALSSEVEADGAPMRLMLLGEKLMAFRDSSGRVGVMDHRCPHRCASLVIGRNEEDGIRCVYHGWKYDVTGACVDMPSVPEHQQFKDKVRAKAYRVAERAGLIWVYMGSRADVPPLPDFEVTLLPEGPANISILQRACNWLQGLEGDIDTSHLGFLHAGSVGGDDLGPEHPMYHAVVNRAPEYKVAQAPWGTTYGAYRHDPDGRISWRIANFLFPFWTQTPNTEFGKRVVANAWVPMDDTHTMMIKVTGGAGEVGNFAQWPMKNGHKMAGTDPLEYLPNDTGWYGRWRAAANPGNDWLIDRAAQERNEIYTGIDGITLQDQAITESMGAITDHAFEHLGPSDQMIARTRRALLLAARAFAETGALPPGASDPSVYWSARSGTFHADAATDWQDAYRDNLKTAIRWYPPAGKEAAE